MKTLRLFRGISVPSASAADVTSSILSDGLIEGKGTWTIEHLWRLPPGVSTEIADLNPADVYKADWRPAVCACGTPDSAYYYASCHNKSVTNNAPILIEFEAQVDQVRIDARDFLCPAFQMGDPEKARSILDKIYGSKILEYVNEAWVSQDQEERVALCHLATMDPAVTLAHYANRTVLRGRYGTTFENAFTVAFPVQPEDITRVWTPGRKQLQMSHSIAVDDIVAIRPAHGAGMAREEPASRPIASMFDVWKVKYGE